MTSIPFYKIGASEVDELIMLINDYSGYDFSDYSMPSLHRRFQRYIDLNKISDFKQLLQDLINDSAMVNNLIEEVTVNVTEMFRDPSFFAAIRSELVPQLNKLPLIKIWHAGCSTGEEVYSMAILLKEHDLFDKSIIYATDINQTVLDVAKSGKYNIESFKEVEINYRESEGNKKLSDYYTVLNGEVLMNDELKSKIIFSTHNLVSDNAFNQFDLIVCRNVLIYFNKSLQDNVLQMFYNSLTENGILAIGSKETLMFSPIESKMQVINSQWKIWKKKV
ncbi:MAG: protein-glutamate O-methyltransferase CheR [Bacteroidia bacterium]|jgi:chemotaxis protein methyltransferase CheR|nr:protein-glutamate O-methyltransferase CheR [Bacteroidia bacterium]